ncbi:MULTISPECIES: glycosyltransferase family 2 protein [unclassified Mesorhizobium]|uniref:glycosyltransferase family 2 protein n=1 Tax=unclassified Mesorhizobium TaxID=325217 RepID=UPI000FE4B95B|nr:MULTISPECIES: glycosyltransferase family 2 protein [unclassified Mesorhizobium]RWC25126.1 MAG: glycosyltransferase [Mesorhizobium sp.]RWD48746.1 MAG: glycosyltransferase [Mesorhizobium sp.]TGT95204.1 glycosyltransferase [Mesorhizobium sp. M5C.F.Ca.ET.164.01.1.1]TIS38239.1 MAG: glycosyltransferase [Mesorhizobium sp.]TIU27720.1 MAG: glycosyltransferase [Mesorhizobium sp.]
MKISVLTVCWNSAATIRHTIDSFFAQDHHDKELVVVDGGSADETLTIVRSYPQDQIQLLSEPDRGMYDALNKGLHLYTGQAVGVLNSDDCFHDHTALSRISAGLEHADIVHGNLDFVENHFNKRVVRRWRAVARPAKGFRTGWMPAHPTFYVRRKVAEAVGAFDLNLKVASDYDWMLRAVELYEFRSATSDHILIDMMVGGASTSSIMSYVRHNMEALQSRRRWLGSGTVDYALVAKPARKFGQLVFTLSAKG